MTQTLRQWPSNSALTLKNERCVYCGVLFDSVVPTKEHVIGRRFVPKGKLNAQWNLIVRACEVCNSKKSELENDISGITLFPDPWGRHTDPHDVEVLEASKRKAANCFSTATGRPIKDSIPRFTVKVPIAQGATLTFNMTASPELLESRVYELARLHCVALFFLITYDDEKKSGGYWIGEFMPLMSSARGDWGNPRMRAFSDVVASWETRFHGITANGYFKAMIRKHPSANCWSWALEWNKNYRVVGFFGEIEAAKAVAAGLPKLEMSTLAEGPDKYIHLRTETPLNEEEDNLFTIDNE